MDLGDSFSACIFETNVFIVPLLTLAKSMSPRCGFNHLSKQFCQVETVAGLIGFRLRVRAWLMNCFVCSRNVTPNVASMNFSWELTPLFATSSSALLLRSALVRESDPLTGQIRSQACTRFSCP